MRSEELLRVEYDSWELEKNVLNRELVEAFRSGPAVNYSDLEFLEGLATLMEEQFTLYGTAGGEVIDDGDSRLLILTLGIVCRRLQFTAPKFPFRDLSGFREFWKAQGMSGEYAPRRAYVRELFVDLHQQIQDKLIESFDDSLLTPVSWGVKPSWQVIDNEIAHLRRRFSSASSYQDYCAVGLACVRIIEFVAEIVFDPKIHLPEGEEVPHKGLTINRFDRVINHSLMGSENQRLRKVVRSVVEFTQEVKHSGQPSHLDAAIACNATLAVVSIFNALANAHDQSV